MSNGKFDRQKAVTNVGTIGHVDHGRTSLAIAVICMGPSWPESIDRLQELLVEKESPVYEISAPQVVRADDWCPRKSCLHPYGPTRRGKKGRHRRW